VRSVDADPPERTCFFPFFDTISLALRTRSNVLSGGRLSLRSLRRLRLTLDYILTGGPGTAGPARFGVGNSDKLYVLRLQAAVGLF
jgi:hypothetical protein